MEAAMEHEKVATERRDQATMEIRALETQVQMTARLEGENANAAKSARQQMIQTNIEMVWQNYFGQMRTAISIVLFCW